MSSTNGFFAASLLLALLLLAGCASQPEKESLFEMPDSVAADLGIDSPEKSRKKKTAESEATGQSLADEDSAAVLERLRQPAIIITARDAEHEKQAKAAKGLYQAALLEMKKGNLDSALQEFRALSGQYPQLAGPLVNQAIILHKKGQLKAAQKLLQDGLLTHGRNPYYLNQLGIYSRELGQFKKAQASYESALRIDPNYAKAHYNLAVLADLYLHDPALALQEFQTYQSLQSQPDTKVAGWIKELERRQSN